MTTLERIREKRNGRVDDSKSDIVTDSVREARESLHRRVRDGEEVICPVCDKIRAMRHRPLYCEMAKFLYHLACLGMESEWVDIKDIDVRGGDYAKLVHWDMVEQHSKDSGLWRITEKGDDFVHERIRVPKSIWLYNNQLIRVSDEETDFAEALGEEFDRTKLMRPVAEGMKVNDVNT